MRVQQCVYTQYRETHYLGVYRDMYMRFVLLFVALAMVTSCPSQRDALDCFYRFADGDGDERVSRKELVVAIDSRLPWWQRTAFHLFGGIDKIMTDCDADQDGYLTRQDALARPDTCMESCFKRQATVDTFKC